MSPAWSMNGGGGGGGGGGPAPATANLMYWTHGYGSGIESAAGVVSRVFDWAGQAQDLDQVESGKEPLTGALTIDGRPTWSFGDGATARYIRRNATMLKPDATPITPSEVRTFWSVFVPETSSTGIGFDITGGPLFNFDEGPYFQPLFDLESFFHPDGFYLFDTAWRFDGAEISGPDTPAATFENIPQIVCWIGAADGGSPIRVYHNGTLVSTSPADSGGVTGPSQTGFISGNCRTVGGAINNVPFQGGIGAELCYLGDQQADSPAGFAQTLAYLRAFFPSGDHA